MVRIPAPLGSSVAVENRCYSVFLSLECLSPQKIAFVLYLFSGYFLLHVDELLELIVSQHLLLISWWIQPK